MGLDKFRLMYSTADYLNDMGKLDEYQPLPIFTLEVLDELQRNLYEEVSYSNIRGFEEGRFVGREAWYDGRLSRRM